MWLWLLLMRLECLMIITAVYIFTGRHLLSPTSEQSGGGDRTTAPVPGLVHWEEGLVSVTLLLIMCDSIWGCLASSVQQQLWRWRLWRNCYSIHRKPELLCLSVSSTEVKLVCSDSAGCLTVLSVSEGTLTPLSQWKAHDFEAWISAFSYWDTQLVYSGNATESLWSIRQNILNNILILAYTTAYEAMTQITH